MCIMGIVSKKEKKKTNKICIHKWKLHTFELDTLYNFFQEVSSKLF